MSSNTHFSNALTLRSGEPTKEICPCYAGCNNCDTYRRRYEEDKEKYDNAKYAFEFEKSIRYKPVQEDGPLMITANKLFSMKKSIEVLSNTTGIDENTMRIMMSEYEKARQEYQAARNRFDYSRLQSILHNTSSLDCMIQIAQFMDELHFDDIIKKRDSFRELMIYLNDWKNNYELIKNLDEN
jgi:hypothetical protein